MGRNRMKSNGDIREESPQKTIKRLTQLLSNTQRELQLSEQIRSQLEKIRDTSAQIKDIAERLLNETDLTDEEFQELNKKDKTKKTELKKLEQRLEMLRDIETTECRLNVKLMSYKKSNKSNALFIDNKEVFVDNSEDNEDTDVDISEYESTSFCNQSRHSSQATDNQTAESWHTFEMEGELKDLKPIRGGRKRAIPERFESFPNSRSKRRFNGMTETDD